MQRTLQEYPNRNRKLIYIFIWSLRWIISFAFFFSLVIYKFNGYIRCVLIFFSSSYIYIHWITNIQFETNEYEICIWQTKKKEYIVQSCKWNENKDKKYICIPKWSRNHSQHKRYELQNKFKIEKRPNGIEIKIVDSA